MTLTVTWELNKQRALEAMAQRYNPFAPVNPKDIRSEWEPVWSQYSKLLATSGFLGEYDCCNEPHYCLLDETSRDRSLRMAVYRNEMMSASPIWLVRSVRFLNTLTKDYQIVIEDDLHDEYADRYCPADRYSVLIVRKSVIIGTFGSNAIQGLWGFQEGTRTYQMP